MFTRRWSPLLAVTLALIPVLIIEADAKSEGWRSFAAVADWIIWAVFAVELAARDPAGS